MILARKLRWLAWAQILGWAFVDGAWAQAVPVATGSAAISPILPPIPPVRTEIFPLAEVKRGQEGVAYTVFEGVTPDPMRVEILGVLNNALGPGKDMILARLHGQKPEYTGVVAGMSGSPVYINGRLVGALSYRIGQFSKEPIAGITPIEQMLEVRDETTGVDSVIAKRAAEAGSTEIQPMDTPLVFGGFSQEAVERFGDRFRAMGLTPVAGLGGADATTPQPEPLLPGSAVSAILVRGDLSIAGTCTVTYVDPTRLLACGHPITQSGPVDMPMTKASVLATLPSPLNAFKIVNTTETVGAFTEDRSSAIMGQFGVKARMIPVSVEVVSGGTKSKTFHFEVLDNRELTPSAMLVSIYQSLQGTNLAANKTSYQLAGEITIEGQRPIRLNGIMAQTELNPASINAALYVTDRFSRIYGNTFEQPTITEVKLKAVEIPERRTAVIESARIGQPEARAGETIDVEVTIHPFQGAPQLIRIPMELPASLAPGTVRLLVSDAPSIDRLVQPPGIAQHAIGLADTVAQLNDLHRNDRVYVTLLDHAAQAVLDSEALPGVPLSMANVFGPLKDEQKMHLSGESIADVVSSETGYAVSGSQVLSITIR